MLYHNNRSGENGRLKPPVKCPGKPGARFDRIEPDRRSRPFYVKQHLVDPRFAPVGSCPEQFRLIPNRGTALSICFKALYCAEPLRTFAGNAPDGLGLTRFQAKDEACSAYFGSGVPGCRQIKAGCSPAHLQPRSECAGIQRRETAAAVISTGRFSRNLPDCG